MLPACRTPRVVMAFCFELCLGGPSIIVFAADLHGKDGRSFQKPHAGTRTNVGRSIRPERFAMGKVDMESYAITVRPSASRPFFVLTKA